MPSLQIKEATSGATGTVYRVVRWAFAIGVVVALSQNGRLPTYEALSRFPPEKAVSWAEPFYTVLINQWKWDQFDYVLLNVAAGVLHVAAIAGLFAIAWLQLLVQLCALLITYPFWFMPQFLPPVAFLKPVTDGIPTLVFVYIVTYAVVQEDNRTALDRALRALLISLAASAVICLALYFVRGLGLLRSFIATSIVTIALRPFVEGLPRDRARRTLAIAVAFFVLSIAASVVLQPYVESMLP